MQHNFNTKFWSPDAFGDVCTRCNLSRIYCAAFDVIECPGEEVGTVPERTVKEFLEHLRSKIVQKSEDIKRLEEIIEMVSKFIEEKR